MLTGELPLGRFAPPSRMVQIDVRLDEVVLRSLEKEPKRRYQHASEVKTDLEGISRAAPGSSFSEWEPEFGLDEARFRDVRSQVSLPAVGLGIVGGIGFFISFGLLVIALNSGTAHQPIRAGVLGAVITLFISLLIAAGASSMARLERYRLCLAACILAVLPCHIAWLIGMPAGVCAWTVLTRSEVQAAFQGKGARKRAHELARDGLAIAVGCLIIALSIGASLWLSAGTAQLDAPATVPSPPPAPAPWTDTVPDPNTLAPGIETRRWIVGPSGPALTHEFASILHLEPPQIERVNKILKTMHTESLALETSNTEQHYNVSGHLIVTIQPYPGPVAKLENQLWTELDGIFSPEQQSFARLNLELDRPEGRPAKTMADMAGPGYFGWGKEGARIELWHVGTWHHWNVKTPKARYSGNAPELPVEYRRFWKEPPNDPASRGQEAAQER
jgi:hypothetical protein